MKRIFNTFLVLFLIFAQSLAQLPQKYDSLYKTIYAKDFCRMVQQHPEIVLLDVRSPGEYSDTSHYASLNIGHLKNAVNINIDTINKNVAMMDQYRDKTLVIYCSHSQRSRRVSKLLTENGFKNCYNLNGGMSSLNQMSEKNFPCKQDWMQHNVEYINLSNSEMMDLCNKEKKLVVVDIRPVMQFENNDSLEENNIGRIKNAINIPYDQFKDRMNELKKYESTPVLVYGMSGDGDAARAAAALKSAGFKEVYHLLAGLNSLVASEKNLSIIENAPPFHILDAIQTLELLKNNHGLIIYDTRPKTEFENKSDKSWRNLGNMKNAMNVSEEDFEKLQLPGDKNTPVLVYGHNEAFKLCNMISAKGYRNVNLLENFYDFVWSGFNVENCKDAKEFLVNHEGSY